MARYDFIAVYIMTNKRNGTLYTGLSSDLPPRIQLHREGRVPGFTRDYDCKLLVWFEQHSFMHEAIKREKQIKRWRRAWKLEMIETLNPDWRDLYLDFL
ncbi:excinuclease ABC, C subunit-like [alpha proteobacterium U9-1i]|nr:excinuclease ABC, C subunit-like [alpha proteobacterium U9-1i]